MKHLPEMFTALLSFLKSILEIIVKPIVSGKAKRPKASVSNMADSNIDYRQIIVYIHKLSLLAYKCLWESYLIHWQHMAATAGSQDSVYGSDPSRCNDGPNGFIIEPDGSHPQDCANSSFGEFFDNSDIYTDELKEEHMKNELNLFRFEAAMILLVLKMACTGYGTTANE